MLKTSTDNLNLERCFEWLREGVKRITAKVAHYHKVIGVAALFMIVGHYYLCSQFRYAGTTRPQTIIVPHMITFLYLES